LTGVYNRLTIDQMILHEIVRSKRYGSSFSLVMLDLDDFKKINDTFGHHVGDEVLRSICRLLQEKVRITDKIGRWGGEEFIILLAETNISDAFLAAEKLCRMIADTPVGNNMRITASIGVCSYKEGQTMEDGGAYW